MDIGSGFIFIAATVVNFFMFCRVNGLQQFLERPQDTSVIKGQTAIMRCSVENPVGRIQWAKNGLMLGYDRGIPGFRRYSIIGSNNEFNLQIEDVNLSDDDIFQCQVSPAENNPPLLAEANLQVLVPPNLPEIVDHSNGSTVEVLFSQHVLQLTCIAELGKPAANIKWFRRNEEITSGVEYTTEAIPNDKRMNAKSVLTLKPRYPEDNGVPYECQAHNDALVSGPLKSTVLLSVQYPPGQPVITGYRRNQTVRVNDTIQMMCTSEGGNPLAQVVWFRNNVQVDFSYNTRANKAYNELTIVAQRSDNDVEYRCEAWNVVNADKPLIVKRKMIVYFPPTQATITGAREVKADETLTLTCTTSNSNPKASITWIPQGSSIVKEEEESEPSPDGGFITVSKIEVKLIPGQIRALYTCSATNRELGITVADTAQVGVLYPPEPPQIFGYTEGDSIRAGHAVEMTCRATGGNPPATLAFYKGSEVLPHKDASVGDSPGIKVFILTSAEDNNAMYKCTATNKATEIPLEVVKKLTVHFPPANVKITSEPVQARSGQRLRLTCVSASSNPPAVITWMHKDMPVQGMDVGMTDAQFGGKSSKNMLEFTPTMADNGGIYGCRATNLVLQETIHDAITLNVLFKPEFLDKESLINIEMGSSREIDLTAKANPPNETYTLLRQGVKVEDGSITSFSLVGGILTVSAIGKNDGGPYTIIAGNMEGVTAFNFSIYVQYPATITSANDVEGELGQSVVLQCNADANPMIPGLITWQRSDFDMTRTLASYKDGEGTLSIYNLEKTDSGTFTCVADNHVGAAATAAVQLIVKFKPSIDKSREYTKAASEKGGMGRLICLASGAPTVTFKWKKDGIPIAADDIKYTIEEKLVDERTKMYENILSVKNVQKDDYATYECMALNEKGEDRFSIEFTVTSKPEPPYNIQFVNATHNSITIKWKNGFSGGLTQRFRVRYKESDTNKGYVQVDVLPENSDTFTVRGLALGTKYDLTVMAYNDLGGSDYQQKGVTARTSNLKPTSDDVTTGADAAEDTPVIIILVVCVVGIFLLALNIGLILFFVRRRKKRLENGSDTTSHTNTIELYGPSKETALYPMTPSDESRSYGTYDKNMDDDFSDDYKSYEDEDLKRVFLPPPEYGSVTYSHNKMDSPTFDHRHPIHTDVKHQYNGSDTDSCRKSPWVYEDPYSKANKGKGTFDPDYMDGHMGNMYEPNGRIGGRFDTRPKSITDMSERSSRPSSRGGPSSKTPPPPPVRSSSKGAADIPPLPARNYGSQELMPRYVPPPGSQSPAFNNNVNVINNPSYEGPHVRTPSPRQVDPDDDMRGHLV